MVMSDRVLSQDETDDVFRNLRDSAPIDPAKNAELFDFRRPDRIAKDQLRSIHLLHENFARSLASSLSAFLRSYVGVDLVSVEQLSFAEFTRSLPSPTCIVGLGLRPYEGSAILELSHSLVFPLFEMLLGGTGKGSAKMNREITEIEKSILDSLFRIILQDLRTAWQAVTFIDFVIENHETEPALLQMLAPNEAIVSISMELRVGDYSGLMNIGMPSIIIKMLRQKFDQQWTVRKTHSSEAEHQRLLKLIKPSTVSVDARLNGPKVMLEDLLAVEEGDVLSFDFSTRNDIDLILNGKHKFNGKIVQSGYKRGFQIRDWYKPSE
jgi:flagellar motor switch protein FliM